MSHTSTGVVPSWVLGRYPETRPDEWVPCDEGWSHASAELGAGCRVGMMASIGARCRIADLVSVGDGCRIGDGCRVGDGVSIGEECRVGDGCRVGEGVSIGEECRVGDGCRVDRWCRVGEKCRLGNHVSIGRGVFISDGAVFERSPLQIHGTRHPCYHAGPGLAGVGCEVNAFDWWRTWANVLAGNHSYTPLEVEEYLGYLDLIEAQDRAIFPGGSVRR